MNKVLKEILSTSLYLLFVLMLTYLFITYVSQRTNVSGESMENTLHDADSLMVDKLSYRFNDPERFDIVVFPPPTQYVDDRTFYIKRIIALPGETIQIDEEGTIYIGDSEENLKPLDEGYGREVIKYAGLAQNPITLGADEYFVMGDNRNNSTDSRAFGTIKRQDIVGKAWIRIWPLDKFGVLKHQ